MNYKIAQLILTPGQNSNTSSEIFISQPDANKEALAGKLFIIVEIESKKSDDLKIINFLINTLNFNYYQSEKMILRERLNNLKVEHIFESALAKTNKKLIEFLQTEKIKLNYNLLNITVGVVYKEILHFTILGKNKAILIFKNKLENTARLTYKIIDITEQTKNSEQKKSINPIKLFSNVISGSIPQGGYFLFSNETLPEYLSHKQLIEIITTLPPASAIEQIKNLLSKINAYVPFLSIIIKNTTGQEGLEPIKTPAASTVKSSVENLNLTEEMTERLLTPSGLIGLGKWKNYLNKYFGKIGADKTKGANSVIFLKRKSFWISIVKIFRVLKDLIMTLIGFIIYLLKTLTDIKKMAKIFINLWNGLIGSYYSLKNSINKFIFWYKKLNMRNKLLFSAVIIILIIFSSNILWINYKNKNNQKIQITNDLINNIEQKQNQVDASLLYSNEDGAKKLLSEIKDLLAQLPKNNDQQKALYEKYNQKNNEQIEKISHVIRINSPKELANFYNLNKLAAPDNLIISGNKIYVGDTAQKSIYNLEIKNNLITATADIKQTVNKLAIPSKDSNNIYYFNSTNFLSLNIKTEELTVMSVDYKGDLNNVVATAEYNNRLYLLNAKDNQIYRFNYSKDKFTGLNSWIKEKADLSGAVSFDIDGNIYILKNNGEILKYLKGQKQEFDLSAVEPALSQPTKIQVSQDLKFIYLLEPVNKRLVVFDKTGKFLSQYLSDKFNDLKDFIVDESANKIYILNGSSLYSFDGQHFE